MDRFVETEIARIKTVVGEKGQVIGAVSGGVESIIAAKLMQQAIGEPVCVVSIVVVQTRRGFALR
jgi:GMP synthase (glutamine-hydrolysing)